MTNLKHIASIFQSTERKYEQVRYIGFGSIALEEFALHQIFRSKVTGKDDITVLGPFKLTLLDWLFLRYRKANFYVTGENRPPQFHLARKHIGFWKSYYKTDNVYRFPYWMWHLDWSELSEVPEYPRYGMPLSIERLMRPIRENYAYDQISARLHRAVLISKHLNEPRKRFYELTLNAIGCDGFGGAFDNDDRTRPKMPRMEKYRFSLCPENSIGDGYITEKIPEAFHSGCIPITWCRPKDLIEDFNPRAVVNLFGLDDKQCNELLLELNGEGELFLSLISEPLLLKKPKLNGLIRFIQS